MSYKHLNKAEVRVAKDGSGIGLVLEAKGRKRHYHLSTDKLPELVEDLLRAYYHPAICGLTYDSDVLGFAIFPVTSSGACVLPNKMCISFHLGDGFGFSFSMPIHRAKELAAEILALAGPVLIHEGDGDE